LKRNILSKAHNMPKPKGMHHSTYINQLREEIWGLIHKAPFKVDVRVPRNFGTVKMLEDLKKDVADRIRKGRREMQRAAKSQKVPKEERKARYIQKLQEKKEKEEKKPEKVYGKIATAFGRIVSDYRIQPRSKGARHDLLTFQKNYARTHSRVS